MCGSAYSIISLAMTLWRYLNQGLKRVSAIMAEEERALAICDLPFAYPAQ